MRPMIEHYTMTGRWRAGGEDLSDLAFRRQKLHSAELRLLGCTAPKRMPHTIEVRLPLEFEWDGEDQVQLVRCRPLRCHSAGKTMAEAQEEIQGMVASQFVFCVEEGSLFEGLQEIGWRQEQTRTGCASSAGAPPPAAAEAVLRPQAWTINQTRGGWKVGCTPS